MSDIVKYEHNMTDLEKMGHVIAKSGLFGIKDATQAVALMLLAQSEGRHPATVSKEYDIIQGRPALKAKAKLARYQQSGGKFRWIQRDDAVCSAEFAHPACPDPVTVTWDMDRAKQAGLGGKDNWKRYPRQMLSARVISEGVDATYPDAGGLMYVPEEVMDFDVRFEDRPALPAASAKKSSAKTKTDMDPITKGFGMVVGELERLDITEDDPRWRSYLTTALGIESLSEADLESLRAIYAHIREMRSADELSPIPAE